jgi:hypothetical protein
MKASPARSWRLSLHSEPVTRSPSQRAAAEAEGSCVKPMCAA